MWVIIVQIKGNSALLRLTLTTPIFPARQRCWKYPDCMTSILFRLRMSIRLFFNPSTQHHLVCRSYMLYIGVEIYPAREDANSVGKIVFVWKATPLRNPIRFFSHEFLLWQKIMCIMYKIKFDHSTEMTISPLEDGRLRYPNCLLFEELVCIITE